MKCYWTKPLSYLQITHCNLPGFPDLAGVSDTAERGPALWLPSSSVVQWRFAGWTRLGTTRDFSPEPGKRRQKHRFCLSPIALWTKWPPYQALYTQVPRSSSASPAALWSPRSVSATVSPCPRDADPCWAPPGAGGWPWCAAACAL